MLHQSDLLSMINYLDRCGFSGYCLPPLQEGLQHCLSQCGHRQGQEAWAAGAVRQMESWLNDRSQRIIISGTQSSWSWSLLESSSANRGLGVMVDSKLPHSQQCPWDQESQWYPLGRALPAGQERESCPSAQPW